jgi:hypothetical protein
MADAYEDPTMKQAYESTGESMRKISGATSKGKSKKTEEQLRSQMRRVSAYMRKRGARSAAPAAAAVAGEVAKKGLLRGALGGLGLPGLVIGTLAYPVMERLIYGSREQQMRDQFETQRKIEQEEMAKMGGVSPMGDMGGVAGGMMPQQEQGMYDLLEDERQTGEDVSFARRRNRALEGLGRSGSSDELDRLLAGQEARMRSIQAPRQLTPYEIMGIIGG